MLSDVLKKDKINTVGTWEKVGRPEIMRIFEAWVCGVALVGPLDYLEARATETEYLMEGAVKKEAYYLYMERRGKSCGFHYRVFSPAMGKAAGTVPVINPFSRSQVLDYPGKELDHMLHDLIIVCGYVGVHADVDELYMDNAECCKEGLWELFPESMEGAAAWGAIGMWAYAANRVVNCLIVQDFAEYGGIVVCGCSRAGKAALWRGAQDEQVGPMASNVSGCTGAAVARRKTGEYIKDIATQFSHWICKHYASFANREEELPVDQHMLLTLCAPRPLYVPSVSEDSWADPQKELKVAKLAGEVYGLYGETGLEGETFLEANISVGNGSICYHNHQGAHGCRRYDQKQYLPFIQNHSN